MKAARADANQPEIVAAWRSVGATVTLLHRVGMGCPDALVGYKGVNYLAEIKDGSKPPSHRALTPLQVDWHRDWRGSVSIVKNVTEALAMLGIGE